MGVDPTEHLFPRRRNTYETEQTQKRPLTRLGLALVAAIVCMGGIVFSIRSDNSSSDNSAANLRRELSQERDRASVAIGGLAAARERENVALTKLESKRIANSKQRESKQARDESEALARSLRRPKACRQINAARENSARARKCRTEANCRCQADGIAGGAGRK